MSNYSEEVIKQANRLMEEHYKAHGTELFAHHPIYIKAAIVSCEFAGVDNFLKVLTSTKVGFTYIKYGKIKSYLEELL